MTDTDHASVLSVVRSRMTSLLWSGVFRENVQYRDTRTADDLLRGLADHPDGTASWTDIAYTNESRSAWRAADHYVRLELALVRGGEARLAADTAYRTRLIAALRYWLVRDFRNPNWWHNDIGMPSHIGDVGLLLWPYLTDDDRARVCALVSRGSMKIREDVARWGGANLIWGAFNTVRHALLTEDEALLTAAAARIADELTVGGEGIRPDGAFWQHGPRWYSGGYGASFTFDMSQLVYLFHDTPLAPPPERLSLLLCHVLDGQRHMMHHGAFDPNGVGRELTRHDALHHRELNTGIRLLASVGGLPRHDELSSFAADLDRYGASDTPDASADGTFFYPSVSYMSHRARGVFIGVKCLDGGQLDAEVCNGEGGLCCNMSYGTRTAFMARGDEYENLTPLLDWSRIPGTTAVTETDAQLETHGSWWTRTLPAGSTYACTDGKHGVITQHTAHDGISLTAAYFLFDGCLIALGAGITVGDGAALTSGNIAVTVDQCRPADPAVTPDGMTASNGGFTYISLDPAAPLTAGVRTVTGSWHRSNREQPDVPVTGSVFLCTIPLTDGRDTYAYAVTPRGTALSADVLSNTPAVQAVRLPDGTMLAAFHADGTYALGGRQIGARAGTCRIVPSDEVN